MRQISAIGPMFMVTLSDKLLFEKQYSVELLQSQALQQNLYRLDINKCFPNNYSLRFELSTRCIFDRGLETFRKAKREI